MTNSNLIGLKLIWTLINSGQRFKLVMSEWPLLIVNVIKAIILLLTEIQRFVRFADALSLIGNIFVYIIGKLKIYDLCTFRHNG